MFGLLLDPEENQLRSFLGQPVCVLLKNGNRLVGRLSDIRAGRLILNEGDREAEIAGESRKKPVRRTKRKRDRKPKEIQLPEQAPMREDTDPFSIPPLGFEPPLSSLPRERVPLHSVDSILIL